MERAGWLAGWLLVVAPIHSGGAQGIKEEPGPLVGLIAASELVKIVVKL